MNQKSLNRFALLWVLPVLVLGACGKGDVVVDDGTATETAPATTINNEGYSRDSNGNYAGAMVGNTQRSWPDSTGLFDDSAHVTPGQYSTDLIGRPVWTPINHDGDLPKKSELVSTFDESKCGELPEIDGKTQIQYVNARYLVVNNLYGPSVMDEGVPGGYAHHPYGAVLAAMNQLGYGTPAQGDEIGYKIDEKLWSTSAEIAEAREFYRLDTRPPSKDARAKSLYAGHSVRLVSCSEDVVTVDVAFEEIGTESFMVLRIPFIWKNDDWRANLTGLADKAVDQPDSVDLDGFGEVYYS